MDKSVGLIAGAGRLPMMVADGIIQSGHRLVVVGLKGFASQHLIGLADHFAWAGVARIGRWISILRKHQVTDAVMIGSVRKSDMYTSMRLLKYMPDPRTALLWYRKVRGDKRDNAVLLAVADELAKKGINLMSSVKYCKEHLTSEGVLTKIQPPGNISGDIEFGWKIARSSADLDIGQSLAVREGDIIAVEAIEGTDSMIRRAGELCPSGGWTLVKVARSQQDMRFDVPVVGPDTIKNLSTSGCCCLVLEAEKTVIADKEATLALADSLGISVIGRLS